MNATGGVYVVRSSCADLVPNLTPPYRLRHPANGGDLVTVDETGKGSLLANGWEEVGALGYLIP